METLDSLGLDVAIVERRFSRSVADVGKFSPRKITSGLYLVLRLCIELARHRPKFVVFFCTNRPASFLVDCALALVMRLYRVKVVNYVHTQGYSALAARGTVWSFLVGHVLRVSEVTVCLGPSLAGDVDEWVPRERMSFIPNTPGEVHRGSQAGGGDMLFLSNLIPEKGVEAFLELALRVAESNPSNSSRIVGATADKAFTDRLIRRRDKSPYGRRVIFAGQADEREKWDCLAAAKVLVFPSTYKYEAQPLTIIESLAVGTPVVAYATGGIPDIIQHGASGLLVEAGDEESLEAAARAVLSDADLYQRLSRGATERFESNFSRKSYRDAWSKIAVHMLGLTKIGS